MKKDGALRLVNQAERPSGRTARIVRARLQRGFGGAEQEMSCRNPRPRTPMSVDEELAAAAAELLAMRRRRDDALPALVGEAAWDILLAAYSSPHVIMQTKELCAISSAPEATTIRWLQVLERNGFLEKAVHPIRQDQRATYYRLTSHGRAKVRHALAAMLHD